MIKRMEPKRKRGRGGTLVAAPSWRMENEMKKKLSLASIRIQEEC